MVSSRNKRTHPNFVCRREKSTFFVFFFQGLCASFLRPLNRKKLLLSFCSTFWGILRTGFHSDCIRQKRECSPSVDWTEIFWPQAKKNYIIVEHVYTSTICVFDRSRLHVSSSFDSGLCVTCRSPQDADHADWVFFFLFSFLHLLLTRICFGSGHKLVFNL